MTPSVTLVRPGDNVRQEVGNDGLTDAERDQYAEEYRSTIGRKSISAVEKQAHALWLANRASS
ncbi:hypothetical protein [Subtercola boreus]|uniref:hypothetical protein n=1 Tax=Subtercola boreus TaxID=120213 RepID=UPI001559F1FF|nr:hypothetical protein [Subtercola boreus]